MGKELLAAASRRDPFESVAFAAGIRTEVVKGLLAIVRVTGALVVDSPRSSVATLSRV
jgi:hypothetical protein